MSSLVQRAQAIRARLRNPPNAVHDDGIDLKRKPSAKVIPITQAKKEAEPVPVNETPAQIEIIPTPVMLDAPPTYPKVSVILQEVAKFYNVSVIDLMSARRTYPLVHQRQAAMYLAKEMTLLSLPRIGQYMGGRDHTTVLHGVRVVKQRLETNERLRDEIDILKLHITMRVIRTCQLFASPETEDATCNSPQTPAQ